MQDVQNSTTSYVADGLKVVKRKDSRLDCQEAMVVLTRYVSYTIDLVSCVETRVLKN